MTAKVTIRSSRLIAPLQIPLTAIFRVDGESFCLVGNEDDEMQIRSIELGSNNMIMAVVKSGLKKENALSLILIISRVSLNRTIKTKLLRSSFFEFVWIGG